MDLWFYASLLHGWEFMVGLLSLGNASDVEVHQVAFGTFLRQPGAMYTCGTCPCFLGSISEIVAGCWITEREREKRVL